LFFSCKPTYTLAQRALLPMRTCGHSAILYVGVYTPSLATRNIWGSSKLCPHVYRRHEFRTEPLLLILLRWLASSASSIAIYLERSRFFRCLLLSFPCSLFRSLCSLFRCLCAFPGSLYAFPGSLNTFLGRSSAPSRWPAWSTGRPANPPRWPTWSTGRSTNLPRRSAWPASRTFGPTTKGWFFIWDLRRKVVSVPRWSPPPGPAAPLRTSGRSWRLHREAPHHSSNRTWRFRRGAPPGQVCRAVGRMGYFKGSCPQFISE
jgi:hypothetical protein